MLEANQDTALRTSKPVTAHVRSGELSGSAEGGVRRFLGVPYAAPPVGALRFKAPQPAPSWNGVRDATQPGPNPPQPYAPLEMIDTDVQTGAGWISGDDYLTLNVWAPDDIRTGLPVLVWIYGGGFVVGTKDAAVHDGSAFARDGVICVAINYRLGIEGFLPIPGGDTNVGLRDQLAGLQWVQDNIAAFGGDPANVTVAGQSAGGVSVALLVASPLSKGLFCRAIVQSGAAIERHLSIGMRVVRRLAKMLGVSPDLDGFQTVSAAKAADATSAICQPTVNIDLRDETGRDPVFGISRFVPLYGDDVLPEAPIKALQNGAGTEVELLVGTTAEEMNLFTISTGAIDKIGTPLALYVTHRSTPHALRLLRLYGLGEKGVKPGKAFTDAANDLVFRAPNRRMAEAHQGRSHVYEMDWRSPALDGRLGAAHALDVPFVFDTLASSTGSRGIAGPNPPQALADRVHKIWVDFVREGQLPWPAFDEATRLVYSLTDSEARFEAPLPAATILGSP